MGEKTEKASPKKLRDARKKGQVAKSQDLPSAFTFMAAVGAILTLMSYFYEHMKAFILTAFLSIPQENITDILPSLLGSAILSIFYLAGPVMGFIAFFGVMINFLAIGPVFAPEALKPDIKKFDPIQNLKSKFKMKTLFELLKSLFKIILAAILIYTVMYKSLPVLTKTVALPLTGSLMVLYHFLYEVLWKVGLMFVVVAIADFVYQKHNFANEMKMEKFEVKQEYKNTEGDPQIKGKRKQIAQDIAYGDGGGPAKGVSNSKAVVSNPTHLAIGIAFDEEIDQAPWITTMGRDKMAKHIIELARDQNVPVMRNIPLAQQLWAEGEIDDFVPEETYEPLAEILKWVASLEEARELGLDEPELES